MTINTEASPKKLPVALRISPAIKAVAVRRAKEENRSFASYVEQLILMDAKAHGALPSVTKK